jgi:hypothetical protein
LGLESRIEPRSPEATWVENCAQKAFFVQEMRMASDQPILWVDADAMLRRPLNELENCTADLAIVKREGWDFWGGQVYFGPGPGAECIIDVWCRYCRDFPHIWDQVSLGYAWWEASLQAAISARWLDGAIAKKAKRGFVSNLWQSLTTGAAIIHKQESRRSKRKQARPIKPEFGSERVPYWWRRAAAQQAPFPLEPHHRRELGLA